MKTIRGIIRRYSVFSSRRSSFQILAPRVPQMCPTPKMPATLGLRRKRFIRLISSRKSPRRLTRTSLPWCAWDFVPLIRARISLTLLFHGAASTDAGLTELKNWAQSIPKSSNVVLYCGCCPLAHCPNLRPAFTAMRDLGFTNLRVLILPNDFNTDWIEKGYPVEKGK